jgi:hypothetical protein
MTVNKTRVYLTITTSAFTSLVTALNKKVLNKKGLLFRNRAAFNDCLPYETIVCFNGLINEG